MKLGLGFRFGALKRGLSVVRNGLALWLDFSSSSTVSNEIVVLDKSVNTNQAKLFTGKTLYFDGNNDTLDISGFQMTGSNATFAFWINPSQAQNTYILDVNISRFVIEISNLTLKITSGNTVSFGAVNAAEWQRCIVILNGTSASCYINGVQLGATQTITGISIGSATSAAIGSIFSGTSTYYDGKLSDFQIYNAVWTAYDVAYDYANPNKLATENPSGSLTLANLKGYWALSEGAGLVAYDSSGGGNNGTISGATYITGQERIPQLGLLNYSVSTPVSDEVTLVANPNNTAQDIRGTAVKVRDNSFNLNGAGFAEIADDNSLDFGTGNFTIDSWVQYKYVNTSNTYNVIMGLGAQANLVGNNSAHLVTNASGFGFIVGGVSAISGVGFTPVVGDWYYVVGNRVGTTIKLSVNSALEATTTNAGTTVTNSSVKHIGRDTSGSRFYKGLISVCRGYNRALSAGEITQNYNAGLSAHPVSP